MVEVKISVNTSASNPKPFLGMRLFRTKAAVERKGSLNSNITQACSHDSIDQSKHRKSSLGKLLKKRPDSDTRAPSVPTSTVEAKDTTVQVTSITKTPRKLQKQQTNFPVVDLSQAYQRDKQTGEQVIDHTDMLHSLVHQESTDTIPRLKYVRNTAPEDSQTGEQLFSRLPMKLWQCTFNFLPLADKAALSLTCKAFHQYLSSVESELEQPENESERQDFLLRIDYLYPNHLFCFACAAYHPRLNPRKESLKPTNVANPIFNCPHSQHIDKRIPRIRLTSGRTLPFTFVQLALRAHNHTSDHGITVDSLSRRWREKDNQWNHQTRYAIVDDHLLVRVISTSLAAPALPPAGLRNLLYNPQEAFNPYFSTCPHWRDGDLMPTVKCALSHIPKAIQGDGINRLGKELAARYGKQHSAIVTLCNNCRPIRRCPECPSEYLIEIKMAEDKSEPDATKLFKQALVVTRWSDLGNGTTPTCSKEWAACSGKSEGFDWFSAIGKRAIYGVFESLFNVDAIPGQRIVDMNPDRRKRGEEGHNWY